MANLEPEVLAELKTLLLSREQELVAELEDERARAAREPFKRVASEAPDVGDASVADLEVDSASAERERVARELREVREALARLDAGTYGICQQCGEPIPLARLRAYPAARYDVAHQEQLERGIETPSL
jgi:DnaK suppressor protein